MRRTGCHPPPDRRPEAKATAAEPAPTACRWLGPARARPDSAGLREGQASRTGRRWLPLGTSSRRPSRQPPRARIGMGLRSSVPGRPPRSQIVQRRGAGVGSRRARSRVNAGVVWCPGCRPLIGHFIGRVLRDTSHADASESASYAGKCPVRIPLRHGPQVPELCHLVCAARAIYVRPTVRQSTRSLAEAQRARTRLRSHGSRTRAGSHRHARDASALVDNRPPSGPGPRRRAPHRPCARRSPAPLWDARGTCRGTGPYRAAQRTPAGCDHRDAG
jgi:hypothetical protein